jgi:hypothetical protein
MSVTNVAMRLGQRSALKRLGRTLPWIGLAVAVAGLASTVKRKGVIGGALDTALNAMPVVGSMKNVAELVRGRDFIRDRASA